MSMSYDSNSWFEDDYGDAKIGQDIEPATKIGYNFKTIEKLGSGSFGQIFLGQCLDGSDTKVAIKFEPSKDRGAQLSNEMKIYKILHGKNDQIVGFPKVYWFGQWLKYNVLVIELLGKNLEEVFQACGQNFTIKTILYLALQLLNRFEFIHSKK